MGEHNDRPLLAMDGPDARQGDHAVALLVQDLQAGWDAHDADVTDRRLAADVLWGSPFGAALQGYDPLHEIHVRLKQQGMGGRASRFELVQSLTPAPGLAVAQVRRVALDDEGRPIEPSSELTGGFSEMAQYVLVARDDAWWVAAGQNTPIRARPSQ